MSYISSYKPLNGLDGDFNDVLATNGYFVDLFVDNLYVENIITTDINSSDTFATIYVDHLFASDITTKSLTVTSDANINLIKTNIILPINNSTHEIQMNSVTITGLDVLNCRTINCSLDGYMFRDFTIETSDSKNWYVDNSTSPNEYLVEGYKTTINDQKIANGTCISRQFIATCVDTNIGPNFGNEQTPWTSSINDFGLSFNPVSTPSRFYNLSNTYSCVYRVDCNFDALSTVPGIADSIEVYVNITAGNGNNTCRSLSAGVQYCGFSGNILLSPSAYFRVFGRCNDVIVGHLFNTTCSIVITEVMVGIYSEVA